MASMRVIAASTGLGALAQVGCSLPAANRGLSGDLTRYEQGQREARLTYVVVGYVRRDGRPALTIDAARILNGSPPLLLDAPSLDGRIELLDAQGRVVSSMGYIAGEPPPAADAGDQAATPSRLVLRMPFDPSARVVRVHEAKLGLSAESELTTWNR